MYHQDNPRPPLPDWIRDTFAILREYIHDKDLIASQEQSPVIARDQAVEILLETGELDIDPSDVNHALERLLQRGFLLRSE